MTWTKKHLTALIGTTLLAGCLATGCSQSAKPQSAQGSTQSVDQPLLPDTVQYGEGINLTGTDGTGNVCMDTATQLTPPQVDTTPGTAIYEEETRYNEPFHRAFWVHSFDQYEKRLIQTTAIEDGEVFDFEDFDQVAFNHYKDVFDGYEGPVLSIVSVIPTADITAKPKDLQCESGSTDLEQWINDCGVRYMGERKLGRYLIMSARVPDLTPVLNENSDWSSFYRMLDVESYTNHFSDEAFELADSSFPGIEFRYHSRTGDGSITLEEWFDLRDDIYTAVEQEEGNPYGVTIWERTPVYDATGALEEVCIQDEITGAFLCYQRFEYWSQRARKSAQGKLVVVEDAYQNPSDYEPVTDTERDNYESVLVDFDQLLNGTNPTIDQMTQDCVNSLATANENTICSECGDAADELQGLVNRLDQISEPELLPPPGQNFGIPTEPSFTVEEIELDKNSPATYRDFYDNICMLSRVSGDFAGGGEAVVITANKPSDDWLMEINSQRNNGSQRVTGTFTCSKGFTRDACGGVYCKHHQECDTNTNTCVTDSTFFSSLENFQATANNSLDTEQVYPPSPFNNLPYIAPLSGISGKMNGLGEGAWTLHGSPRELKANSQVGSLRGFSTGMRLFGDSTNHVFPAIDPTDPTTPEEFTIETDFDTADRIEETLLSSTEAFCYVVHIKGDFDGAGENVGVENVNGTWVLRAKVGRKDNCGVFSANNCEPKPVRVKARCVRY